MSFPSSLPSNSFSATSSPQVNIPRVPKSARTSFIFSSPPKILVRVNEDNKSVATLSKSSTVLPSSASTNVFMSSFPSSFSSSPCNKTDKISPKLTLPTSSPERSITVETGVSKRFA